MRVKLQLVMCSDDGQEDTITDIVTLQKDSQRLEHGPNPTLVSPAAISCACSGARLKQSELLS